MCMLNGNKTEQKPKVNGTTDAQVGQTKKEKK